MAVGETSWRIYMARVYVFFVVHSAGAGEEELSPETFSKCEFLADKGRMSKWCHYPKADWCEGADYRYGQQ